MILENLKIVSSTGRADMTLENDTHLVELSDYHETICCEAHYIDWEYRDQVTPEMRFTLNTDDYNTLFERVEGYGIRLLPNPGTGHPISIPGYGRNNGFYSDDIILVIKITDKTQNTVVYKKELDISECQK